MGALAPFSTMETRRQSVDVKEAVRTAKSYLVDLFEDEQITNVGLEEVVFDEASSTWKITIGFSRSWDLKGPLSVAMAGASPDRSYKILTINSATGQVESLRDRVLWAAEG